MTQFEMMTSTVFDGSGIASMCPFRNSTCGAPAFALFSLLVETHRGYQNLCQLLTLSHAGTVIIVDNVVRSGKVADASSGDEDIEGIRRMTECLATQPNISATAIQTVGGKSYDGFLMAIVGGGA